MKVTFLGTNGWYDTGTGNTPCVLIETDKAYIILDAGFGIYKVKDIIKDDKPVYLFLSHLHLDHIIGLHTLPIFKFAQGVDIFTPRGMGKLVRGFLKRPFTSPPLLLSTRLRFHEIGSKMKLAFGFEALKLKHSVTCFGYRFTDGRPTITYCTDTGLCANLKRLAKDADLLITECAMAPGDKSPNLFHITPETAAKVALESGAKKLALCHFDPGKYPTLASRKEAEMAARLIFNDTSLSYDGMTIVI
jgi:ribonuclease BN (tRNA processing enzyme)